MNHESNESPSLGMISTATCTTATVSPLSPLTDGSALAQSANSGFAAALRKLAKQAEEPRGSAVSGESSPVLPPVTSHSSPVTSSPVTAHKHSSVGPLRGHNRGNCVPSTPPVVTIAPTKATRTDRRQVEPSVQALHRKRVGVEYSHPQQETRNLVTYSPQPLTQTFHLASSSIMQDPRTQSLSSLPGQMHPMVSSGAVPEEYLRTLRPFATSDDLRLTSLPLSLDPAAATAYAAAASAYYHPAYLHHPMSLPRIEESLCLSALRSQFYSGPAGGAFPPLHPSALHLHLPGSHYIGELKHTALAERLQMQNELCQREREQERERELKRKREAGLEQERERAWEREREQDRELDRQKERQRERQQQMVRAVESHYLAELQTRRAPPEDRTKPGDRLTANRLDKPKNSDRPPFPAPKHQPLQAGHHSSRTSVAHVVPSLVPSLLEKHSASAAAVPDGVIHVAASMASQRVKSEETWLPQQQGRGQEREGQLAVSFKPAGNGMDAKRDVHRATPVHHSQGNKDVPSTLGAPPPLISPRGHYHLPPSTTLWNPASLVDTPTNSCRKLHPPNPPSRPPPGLTRAENPSFSCWEKLDNRGRKRGDGLPSLRGSGPLESWTRSEEDGAVKSLNHQHHLNNLHRRSLSAKNDLRGGQRQEASSPSVTKQRSRASSSMMVYDEVSQQYRRLLSKLDLEERRKREAREGGYFYDLNESYDESDEEEVKAHLKRVTEQPPLKLDASSEKVDFLRACGLTTLDHCNELLAQKRRKRRRMIRERSPSPPAVRSQSKTALPSTRSPTLSTPYSAEQMDSTPKLEEKKDFLLQFNLSHVSPQQRRDKQKVEELLRAIKKKTVTLDTLRYNPSSSCTISPVPSTGGSSSCRTNRHMYPESPSPSPPYMKKTEQVTRVPPPLVSNNKAEIMEVLPNRKHQNRTKNEELKLLQTGSNQPWERCTPEVFAQHFHQAVLKSTQKKQTKNGIFNRVPDTGLEEELKNISHLKKFNHNQDLQRTHVNGYGLHSSVANSDSAALSKNNNGDMEESGQDMEEEEDDEEDETQEEEDQRRWKGIEAIFEAYHEHVNEWNIERQVLHSQCKQLEAQNYDLTRTAEQLSLTMGDLVSQRQKVREEWERLQDQLGHFRRCLTLPNIHWGRGQVS
ncbi:genetic suppressor element 1-like isoform X1 [Cynoglossus semilaevis]|uniref:Genetic suppressor element 1-like n=1 Tax=Cynoglossus semilaevis TaxID=244447 RepID=A0A3P8V8Z6_CYNSE|nr:genetic suppressor element 1-like isoform X1 [Cynoglossus semilaevis]